MHPKPSPSPASQPKGKSRTTSPPSSQTSGSSSSPTEPPQTPTATSALDALDQVVEIVKQYPTRHLAQKRKDEVIALINLARNLFASEAAALRAGAHSSRPGASAPGGAPPPDLASLLASALITEQAVASLRGDIKQIVTSSVQEALKSTAPAQAGSIPPAPQPARPPRDGPRHLDVTIGIPLASRSDSLAKLSAAQLKNEVDAALDGSGIAGLKDTRVRGVRRLPTGSLLVRASSEEQADLLFRHDGAWLPHLRSLRGARVERKSYMLIASSVPMDFDPSAPSAAESLWLENSGTVATKGAIRDLRWLHAGRSQSSLKREGSLVFSVADATAADQLIYSSLSVRGALCSVSKFVPPPMQCFSCQQFGHVAKACPHATSASSIRCARCAGTHALRDCLCPAKTKCSDARHCTHIKVQCANCKGPHKSFDSKCPVKALEQGKVAARFDNGSCYYSPSFHPPPPRARCTVVGR